MRPQLAKGESQERMVPNISGDEMFGEWLMVKDGQSERVQNYYLEGVVQSKGGDGTHPTGI